MISPDLEGPTAPGLVGPALPNLASSGRSVALVAPEFAESTWCQFRIFHGMRDVLVTEIRLNRSRVVTVVRELVAASVPKHMWVDGKG